MKKRALLSVSDKTGIQEFARALVDRGWEILSTGGTARALRETGLEVIEVAEVTGHPEMMEGRVKTLHPAVHAGLLARRDNADDMSALEAHGYGPIDLVAVNLYPFKETVAKPGVTLGEAVEKIDIGGPTMIRSAAKNAKDVWVVVEPTDYPAVLEALDSSEDQTAFRLVLAGKVFRHVSDYDGAIAGFLGREGGSKEASAFPSKCNSPSVRVLSAIKFARSRLEPSASSNRVRWVRSTFVSSQVPLVSISERDDGASETKS
jgi:phosphoribosylaminoimidazolecarboxamide formyltransferase/IMP cyclohydrolase